MNDDKPAFPTLAGTLYIGLISFLYLFGYWSVFDVNVLEYTALSDVIKLAVYPVATSFVFLLIGAVFGDLITRSVFKNDDSDSYLEAGKIDGFVAVISLLCLAAGICIISFLDFGWRWSLSAAVFSIAVSYSLRRFGVLKKQIPHSGLRRSIIYISAITPLMAFAWGRQKAERVIDNSDYKVVSSTIFRNQTTVRGHKNFKYVGVAGEYFFLLTMDNKNIIVVKYSDLHMIQFNRQSFHKPNQP